MSSPTVFGACALSLDQKLLSGFGMNIRAGAQLGPTIFPVVFAAITARLMKGMALRRAEQGTNLGVSLLMLPTWAVAWFAEANLVQLLEQLNGSQSFAGAIERIIFLRRYSLIGSAVIIMWCLSPLGGQSSLRILDISTREKRSEGQIWYFNTTAILGTSVSAFATVDRYNGPSMMALLQASLLEPDSITDSSVDLWNNVKIPRMDEMSPFTAVDTENPWIIFEQTTDSVWSSLSGLMIQGLPADGISRLEVESSYIDLECSDSVQFNSFLPGEDFRYVFEETGLRFHNASYPFTAPAVGHGSNNVLRSNFFVDSTSPQAWWNSKPHTPLNIVYGSTFGANIVDLFNCSLGIARVESTISCAGSLCAVQRMRRSNLDKRSPSSSHSTKTNSPTCFSSFPSRLVRPVFPFLLLLTSTCKAARSPLLKASIPFSRASPPSPAAFSLIASARFSTPSGRSPWPPTPSA